MIAFEILAWVVVAGVSVPLLVLSAECLAALLPGRCPPVSTGPRPRCVVLVPAHNEAAGIERTLRTVVPQLDTGDSVLVVADNCTDQTAGVVRAAGCGVVERADPGRRGKGYALAHGVDHLRGHPPEVVVILDADCVPAPGAIDRLVREAARTAGPVQGAYRMDAPAGSGPDRQVAAFAFTVKNVVRPLGLARLGLPCLLTGSGMAFPWAALAAADLGHGHIVEDMQLAIDFTRRGRPVRFVPGAEVRSEFPVGDRASAGQRRRWEHGHLTVMVSESPRLILGGLARRQWDMVGLGLDLAVPPVSALLLVAAGVYAVVGTGAVLGGTCKPVFVLSAVNFVTLVTLWIVWLTFGRENIGWTTLVRTPIYVMRKIAIYLAFVINRERMWVRTER